jgi:sugar lactone lactonase YvrE
MRRSDVLLTIALIALTVALFSLPSLADAPQYNPQEIGVDGSGDVFVIVGPGSTVGAGVFIYAPDGKVIKSYRVDEYADLAIGGDDCLYLSNNRRNYVERIEKNGSSGIFWREDSPGRYIDYIAADRNGTLYVSDFYYSDSPVINISGPVISISGRILKISLNGTVTGLIENSTSMPMDKQFKLSVSPNGTIYMTDMSRYVRAIYPDGGRSTITPAGTDKGPTDMLVDVAASDDEYLYVTDSTGGYVYKLAPNGTVVARWGGCGPDRFMTPFSVATDAKGRVYVSDMMEQRVVWFDSDRYRFGNNMTENVAGKGELWDNVVGAGDMASHWLPGDEIMPRQSIPGYNAVIAIIGLCLAGIYMCLRKAKRN